VVRIKIGDMWIDVTDPDTLSIFRGVLDDQVTAEDFEARAAALKDKVREATLALHEVMEFSAVEVNGRPLTVYRGTSTSTKLGDVVKFLALKGVKPELLEEAQAACKKTKPHEKMTVRWGEKKKTL